MWKKRKEKENLSERETMLRSIALGLLIVTAVILLATVALFALPLSRAGRFPISWFSFGVGVIGGFVSIQQRLKNLSNVDLAHLSASWVHIVVPPFFGGIFALVLYVLMLSGIVEGALFPIFSIPDFADQPTNDDLRRFLLETYPASGSDFAKLTFWSFAAGFSERLVPNIISQTTNKGAGITNNTAGIADGTNEITGHQDDE